MAGKVRDKHYWDDEFVITKGTCFHKDFPFPLLQNDDSRVNSHHNKGVTCFRATLHFFLANYKQTFVWFVNTQHF